MIPRFDFSGKTVLVTGSIRNLGLAIASGFAHAGARVVLHGPDQDAAVSTRDRIAAEIPGSIIEAQGFDLADPDQIKAGFAALKKRELLPDILVNNAAHLGIEETGFLNLTPELLRQVFETNFFAVFLCSQLAALEMKTRGGGAIINISSLGAEKCIWHRSAYNASKAANDGLSRSMSLELAPWGIRVNTVAPGYIWTERWNDLSGETAMRRRANIPCGQPTRQEEIANLVLFLASESAPSMVGSQIVIDGGLSIQQVPRDVAD